VPVLLVRGARANAAMVAMTDSLAAHLPRAHPAAVAGANHFLVSTHAAACAELLLGFLD
jgi:pimeloyl-ACP methyl ester carboxylesterase